MELRGLGRKKAVVVSWEGYCELVLWVVCSFVCRDGGELLKGGEILS